MSNLFQVYSFLLFLIALLIGFILLSYRIFKLTISVNLLELKINKFNEHLKQKHVEKRYFVCAEKKCHKVGQSLKCSYSGIPSEIVCMYSKQMVTFKEISKGEYLSAPLKDRRSKRKEEWEAKKELRKELAFLATQNLDELRRR